MSNGKEIVMLHCQGCQGTVFKVFSVLSLKDDDSMSFYGTKCVACGALMDTALKPFVATLDSRVLKAERIKAYH